MVFPFFFRLLFVKLAKSNVDLAFRGSCNVLLKQGFETGRRVCLS